MGRQIPVAKRRVLSLAVVALALAPSAQAFAESRCTKAKWKAAARLLSDTARCEARAVSEGAPSIAACRGRAERRFTRAIEKAEGKGDCSIVGNQPQLQELTESHIARIRGLLEPDGSTCCDLGGLCMSASPEECISYGEIPGPAGTVCSGTGSCDAKTTPGQCCQLLFGEC